MLLLEKTPEDRISDVPALCNLTTSSLLPLGRSPRRVSARHRKGMDPF